MKSAILRDRDEIQEFFANFGQLCKNPININYFLNADRIRAFYKNGKMIGGYVVNTKGPLRYQQMIPEPARSREEISKYFENGKSCEITCFWMVRPRLTCQERNNVYLYSAYDALSMGTTWVFGGSVNVKLARTQKRVMPHVIYRGPWDFEGSPSCCQVYYANWWQLLALVIGAYAYTTTMDLIKNGYVALRRARKKMLSRGTRALSGVYGQLLACRKAEVTS
ncbi:hypothetical protein [Aquisalimonas sp.]|uniref:hypothetical protein n=1 Tax=Aquisalimonas sp. TaxID=1872621 RepID=UPI0025B825ED|nr:hypothetical protein [Aquisalimonas sp.]